MQISGVSNATWRTALKRLSEMIMRIKQMCISAPEVYEYTVMILCLLALMIFVLLS